MEKAVCIALDPDFCKFELCELKPNEENIPAFSMILRLLQLPLANVIVTTEIYYQTSLLTNRTIDGCTFLKNRRRNPSFVLIYNLIEKNSNVNHTCPFNHDLRVYDIAPKKFAMPLPTGKYIIKSGYTVSDKKRFQFDFTMKVF
uniref:MD-2-related lipid-recognition domain-containing protein n=1 Tax=Stomoxys calcitrans TaxID=35570 RepID=A0A1I8NWB5_STOCA